MVQTVIYARQDRGAVKHFVYQPWPTPFTLRNVGSFPFLHYMIRGGCLSKQGKTHKDKM